MGLPGNDDQQGIYNHPWSSVSDLEELNELFVVPTRADLRLEQKKLMRSVEKIGGGSHS